jgi:SNF family Na+-dependent transporter
MAKQKEQWGTRLGVILAVAGSAVGLGNFLRFPGQAAQNGGGIFMIPYFCALLFLGLPLCWAEWIMGKYGGQRGFNSCPAIFGVMGRHPIWRYFGVLGLLIPIIVYMYYVLLESWCLGYAWSYLTGAMDTALGTDPALYREKSTEFFDEFVGGKQDGLMMDGRLHISVIVWAIVFAINFMLIYRGIAMPLMALCAFVVLFRVLTLGTPNPELPDQNVINGLGFMWNPQPMGDDKSWLETLMRPKVWLAAAGQIFFSLSVGFGIIINYASYLRRKDDIVLSGLTASATNEFFEVCMGGLITIPAAFVFLGVAGAAMTGTFDLGFKTLPIVFKYMAAGQFFGFVWFFMLFLAAITSSLSMLQPAIAFLEEALNIGRRASVALLGMVTVLGSLFVIYFSKGQTALRTLDDWVGTNMIVVLAAVEVILFAYIFGAERGRRFALEGAEMKLPRVWVFVVTFISPVYILAILGSWAWFDLPAQIKGLEGDTVKIMAIWVIAAVLIFLLVLVNLAGKRWQLVEEQHSPDAPNTER